MMPKRRRFRLARLWPAAASMAVGAAVLFLFPAAAIACPGCVSPADQQVQEGFFWGLVLMMIAPWVVVGTIGGGLYLAIRRERRQAVEDFIRSEAVTAVDVLERSDVGEP